MTFVRKETLVCPDGRDEHVLLCRYAPALTADQPIMAGHKIKEEGKQKGMQSSLAA